MDGAAGPKGEAQGRGLAYESLRIALAQLEPAGRRCAGQRGARDRMPRRARAASDADLVAVPRADALRAIRPRTCCSIAASAARSSRDWQRGPRRGARLQVMVGFPGVHARRIYNSAALIADGEVAAIHRKAELPNYKVFDEKRYFQPGTQPTVVERQGLARGPAGLRGLWEPEPCAARARGRCASCWSSSTPHPTRSTSSASVSRCRASAVARRRLAGRLRQSASAARTSWCSTATRS